MDGFGVGNGDGLLGASAGLPQGLRDQVEAGIVVLREGGVIAFPTDTLYGLGADFRNLSAVRRVLEIKGRSAAMGLPLLLSGAEQLSMVAADVSEAVLLLARHFWPGALTIVVTRAFMVSNLVTGGRPSVAVRVPNHPVPRVLAYGLGWPIIGTSANLTGQTPARNADEVRRDMGARVDMVIDGGEAPLGIQSTIVDATGPDLRLLRPGAIPLSVIQSACSGTVQEIAMPPAQ